MTKWTIVVKKIGVNNFRYNSFENSDGNMNNATGKIIQGKVGNIPTPLNVTPDNALINYQAKLREGFKIFKKDSDEKIITLQEAKDFFGVNNFTKKYKIDSKGNIKNYNYERPNLNIRTNNIKVKRVSDIINDNRKIESFMRYFKTIPLALRNNIRELGDSTTSGTIMDRAGETFYFAYEGNKILGVYSINRTLGKGSVLYVKSNQNNKKEITLNMLNYLTIDTFKDTITMRNISPTVKNVMVDNLGYDYLVDKNKSELKRELEGLDVASGIFRFVNKW